MSILSLAPGDPKRHPPGEESEQETHPSQHIAQQRGWEDTEIVEALVPTGNSEGICIGGAAQQGSHERAEGRIADVSHLVTSAEQGASRYHRQRQQEHRTFHRAAPVVKGCSAEDRRSQYGVTSAWASSAAGCS